MNLVLFGVGGHALEVLDVVLNSNLSFGKIQFCVSEPCSPEFLDYELISWRDLLVSDPRKSLIHLAIGDSAARARLTAEFELAGFSSQSVISPVASISQSASIKNGCFVGDFSYIGPKVHLGKSVLINNSVTISHNGVVNDFVTVSPGAKVNGHVQLGEGAFVGSGAVIRNGTMEDPIVIGAESTIGAGAMVLANVDFQTIVVGNPAKAIISKGRIPR